jgi:hypothetical protein
VRTDTLQLLSVLPLAELAEIAADPRRGAVAGAPEPPVHGAPSPPARRVEAEAAPTECARA